MSRTKLIIATSTILAVAAAFATDRKPRDASDMTAASVAALEANLGNPEGLEVDEVRVTDDGVACIEYRLKNAEDDMSRGHAVVQGEEVLKSSSDAGRFDKAWSKHCLGPRGGMNSSQ